MGNETSRVPVLPCLQSGQEGRQMNKQKYRVHEGATQPGAGERASPAGRSRLEVGAFTTGSVWLLPDLVMALSIISSS